MRIASAGVINSVCPFGEEKVHWTFSIIRLTSRSERE
jgi:hypothetical protein